MPNIFRVFTLADSKGSRDARMLFESASGSLIHRYALRSTAGRFWCRTATSCFSTTAPRTLRRCAPRRATSGTNGWMQSYRCISNPRCWLGSVYRPKKVSVFSLQKLKGIGNVWRKTGATHPSEKLNVEKLYMKGTL